MGGLGVKVQHFPLTLLVVLTTLTLPCERDTTEVMANFLVKFPIFRYHDNRGRLSKV